MKLIMMNMKASHIFAAAAISMVSHTCLGGGASRVVFNRFVTDDIRIFSEHLAITNISVGGVVVDLESFARRFKTAIVAALPSTNAIEREEYPGNVRLFYGESIRAEVFQTRDDSLKSMLARIVTVSMFPADIAKGFEKLKSTSDELLLLETDLDRDRPTMKVLHWCSGNVFAVVQTEAGLEKGMEIVNMLRRIAKESAAPSQAPPPPAN